jgi:hypothetical protein
MPRVKIGRRVAVLPKYSPADARVKNAHGVGGLQSTMKRRAPSAVVERCGMLSSATW